MNFELFNQEIEKSKSDIISNNFGENYVLMVLLNILSIEDIDFNAFKEEDVFNVMESFEDIIIDEDDDGNLILDPISSYYQMMEMGGIIGAFVDAPKFREPSPFTFL